MVLFQDLALAPYSLHVCYMCKRVHAILMQLAVWTHTYVYCLLISTSSASNRQYLFASTQHCAV